MTGKLANTNEVKISHLPKGAYILSHETRNFLPIPGHLSTVQHPCMTLVDEEIKGLEGFP